MVPIDSMMQFKQQQGNPGLELWTWGHPVVTDSTIKVEEAKGGNWAATQEKWGQLEVDPHSDRIVCV